MSWEEVFAQLEAGTVRAAINNNGQWQANVAVKEAILDAFRDGYLVEENGFVDSRTRHSISAWWQFCASRQLCSTRSNHHASCLC